MKEFNGRTDPDGGVLVLHAGAQRATAAVIQFIDDHSDRFVVEPIHWMLSERAVTIAVGFLCLQETDGHQPRADCDAELVQHNWDVAWDRKKDRGISELRKMWRLLKLEGIDVVRSVTEQSMHQQGARGSVAAEVSSQPGIIRPLRG